MGSGASSQDKAGAEPLPSCPLFYNFTPSTQHIPASTLPSRDSRGQVRRPGGGCSARVIALRQLPVVTAEAKRQAKEFLSNVSKMKKAKKDDVNALAKIADVEAQARAIHTEPSLSPAMSSCFLVNIAVDEQGRLAPLSTGGAAGLTDGMAPAAAAPAAAEGGDGDTMSETGSAAPRSQGMSSTRRGFNFDNNNNNTSGTPGNGNDNGGMSERSGTPSPQAGQGPHRKPPAGGLVTATPDVNRSSPQMAAPPSPRAGGQRVSPPVQRLSGGGGGAAAGGPPSPQTAVGAKAVPSAFVPPTATLSDGDDDDDIDSNARLDSSTRSLLIKDSRFRRPDGAGEAPVANILPSGPSTNRLRRQNSRIRLMQVPNRTRWFLFNDSRTHEAQVTVKFCYMATATPAPGVAGIAAANNAEAAEASRTYMPAPGEMKMMCVPTPLSHKPTATKDLKKQLSSMSSSSRSFVEMEPVAVAAVREAFPVPPPGEQQELLECFERQMPQMAAVQLFVVLAPGTTVFLAEGEATGYILDTHMVPFRRDSSMAVLGRLLTPELVRAAKAKALSLNKDCYRHKLAYVAELAADGRAGVGVAGGQPAQATLAAGKPAAFMPDFGAPVELYTAPPPTTVNTATAAGRNNNGSLSATSAVPLHAPHAETALPPIAQRGPLATPPPSADAEPLRSADGTPLPAGGQPQQRLSHRSPTTSPSKRETGEFAPDRAGSPDTVPMKKRIGSMLRNPTLMAASQQADEMERQRSFHRNVPAGNSLAISF